ncbi:MAG TPA: peptidoglycan-associated lipoprotein Pal [Candidatus Angelobacter sp.]
MNRSEKNILILAALLLAMMVSGCGGKKPVQQTTQNPPPQPKPVTATLSASPTSIQRGQSSTLTWTTENADNVTLQGAKVDAGGSQSVSPTRSTDYHLIATGPGGTQDATARVTVAEQTTTTTTTTQTDEEIFNAAVQDVYFDYDRADLRPDAQQSLAKAAQVISQHPNWRVRIEGNCDERGSTEYNLSLGEERAGAARQALSQGGVGGDRLQTISYGKEKPVCTESSEDCWQKNRHDHFVLLK